jgi:hypothetical protein
MNTSTYETERLNDTVAVTGSDVTDGKSGRGRFAQGPDSLFVTYPSLDAMVADLTPATRDAMAPDFSDAALSTIPIVEHARNLLRAVLIEIEWLPVFGADLSSGRTLELKGIRDRGIPYAPAKWDAAPLSDAERQACSRATLQLQGLGLLERITEPRRDRVTHVRPTASGLRLALQLAGPDADRLAIREGLGLTTWGKELADGMQTEPCPNSADAPDELKA